MTSPHAVLVTGCAGFIGSNLVTGLKKRFPRVKIVGIDDFSNGRKELLDKNITFYRGSITDVELLEKIFKEHKPEYVFHFAALARVPMSVEFPTRTTMANIAGTVALLEKCRDHKVKRFIYSASSSAYGDAKKLPTKEQENPPNPKSPYALQKYTGEVFCKMFSNLFGFDTVSLRYFNIFGPGQYGGSAYATVVCNWLEGMYFPKRQKPFLEGNGRQSRDFCYVGNVVDANIRAMLSRRNFKGEVFNVASGTRTDLLTVKSLIEKYTGRKLDLERRKPRLGDVRHTHADIGKAQDWFGFRPEADFETGLQKTIKWFEERKH